MPEHYLTIGSSMENLPPFTIPAAAKVALLDSKAMLGQLVSDRKHILANVEAKTALDKAFKLVLDEPKKIKIQLQLNI